MSPMRDYFEHSLFIGRALSHPANERLGLLIDDVCEELAANPEKSNLYLTGSLARQEPSLRRPAVAAALSSDIDFVLAGESADAARQLAKALRAFAAGAWPEHDVSVVSVDFRGLANLRSCFGRDLTSSEANVLHRGLPHAVRLQCRPIRRDHLLETAVHQVATYMLTPHTNAGSASMSHVRDRSYHRVRAILELMRWQLAEHGSFPTRFSELAEHREEEPVKLLLPAPAFVRVLKAREISDDSCEDIDPYDITSQVAARRFVGASAGPGVTLSALAQHAESVRDVCSVFRIAILALAVGLANKGALEAAGCAAVRRVLAGLDGADAPGYEGWACRTGLARLKTWDISQAHDALRVLREDYLKNLERLNVGNRAGNDLCHSNGLEGEEGGAFTLGEH